MTQENKFTLTFENKDGLWFVSSEDKPTLFIVMLEDDLEALLTKVLPASLRFFLQQRKS